MSRCSRLQRDLSMASRLLAPRRLATGYEVYVAERKPAIESAQVLEAKQADVLCLQEYWTVRR